MKKNLVLLAGVGLSAFSALGYYGNFVQWSNAVTTKATILNSEQQWLRHGAGNINLEIRYSVDGSQQNGTASVSASTLQENAVNGEIDVFYMRQKPDRVIPVAVLKQKQTIIYGTLCAGVVLTILGILISVRRKAGMTS